MIGEVKIGYVIRSRKSGCLYEIIKVKGQGELQFKGLLKLLEHPREGFSEYNFTYHKIGRILENTFHKPNFDLDTIGTLKFRKGKVKNGKL